MTIGKRQFLLLFIAMRVTSAAEAVGGGTATVLHREEELGIKRGGREPRQTGTGIAQAIRPEKAGVDQRSIDEIPGVGMGRIMAAEFGEELAGFELEIPWQRHRLEKSFFELDFSFAAGGDKEHRIHLAAQVGIDAPFEGKFRVLEGEAALAG